MIEFLTCFYIISAVIYSVSILALLYGLLRLAKQQKKNKFSGFVTVIVPARNEQENIEKCLSSLTSQVFPENCYEVIVVDDASTDNTRNIIMSFQEKFSHVKYFYLKETSSAYSAKKRAIELGVQNSQGDIVLTIDADCVAGPYWLQSMVECYSPDTGVVASWLVVKPDNSLLSKLEMLDSLSLVLIGAAGFGLKKPFMANGANFSYRRDVFLAVDGFDGIYEYGSGDDDLFLQKVSKHGQWDNNFCLNKKAIVTTGCNPSLKDFFMQRMRWASKGNCYPKSVLIFEGFAYICFVLILAGPFLSLFSSLPVWAPLIFLLSKIFTDSIFIRKGMRLVGIKFSWLLFLIAQVFQMLYIVFMGILSLSGRFQWKGRFYKKGKIDPAEQG